MNGGIFISYRREDTRHAAGRLVDRLSQSFGSNQLFMDVDNIDLGLDFAKVLTDKVAACDVMLVVIGPQWIQVQDGNGNRRIDDPRDFVRIEVEAALARDVRAIPILVDGAQQLRAEDLPLPLQPLARLQATRVNHESFGADVDRIVKAIERIGQGGSSTLRREVQTHDLSEARTMTSGSARSITPELIVEVANELGSLERTYYAPKIPPLMLNNARNVAQVPMTEPIHVLFDRSVFGSAKQCVALGTYGIWARYNLDGPLFPRRCAVSWNTFLSQPISRKPLFVAMRDSLKIGDQVIAIAFSSSLEHLLSFLQSLKEKAFARG